jgi:hypothetical protein
MLFILLVPVVASIRSAEAQTAAANLEGVVTDQSGAVLPGVSVTVTNPATGFGREATSDERGAYRFTSLPAGSYTVSATITGFAPQTRREVILPVGNTIVVSFQLSLGAVEQSLTVTAQAPLLRAAEGSIATTVTPEHVETLPLNGRQFANLAVFTPGVQLGFFQDPTKTNTLSINASGGQGRQVAYTVDGGDNNEDIDGGYTSLYSLEAVQEFVVQTQTFKAEYGGSNSAVVNVVTKSGTNDVHGGFFSLFRNESLNARTTSETLANVPKADYARKQFGGSIGGPIRKNRVHFFAAAERLSQDIGQVFNSLGLFPERDTVYTVPIRQNTAFAKADFVLSQSQRAFVRYGYERYVDTQGAGPTVDYTFTGENTNRYHNVVVNHAWVMSHNWLNDLTVGLNTWQNLIAPHAIDPIDRTYPNGVSVGWNADSLPQSSHIRKITVRNDVAFHKGSHDVKFGFSAFDNGNAGGDFSTGRNVVHYAYLDASPDGRIGEISINGGVGANTFSVAYRGFSPFVQDDWKIGRLTLNLGVRYDYIDGFGLDQSRNPLFAYLATHDVPAFAQDSYMQGPIRAGKTLENDKNNIQPRVGFALDLAGNGKNVVRGGVGIYTSFPNGVGSTAFPSVTALGVPYGVVYDVVNQTGIRNPDGSLFKVGNPLPANQLTSTPVFDRIGSPEMQIPYARQYSLAFARQLTPHWVVEAGTVRSETRDSILAFRTNYRVLMPDGTRIRRYSPFGFNETGWRVYTNGGWSDYKGLNLELRGRVSDRVVLNWFYTLSSVIGNTVGATDTTRTGGAGFSATTNAVPFPLDPFGSVGPLATDARHMLSVAGTFEVAGGVGVSTIFRAHSAYPYSVFTGKDDNLDSYNFDLPPGVLSSMSGRQAAFSQFDVRLTKKVAIGEGRKIEGILQVFNLFNAKNPSDFNGNMSAAGFGRPTAYAGDIRHSEQRLAEIGLRVAF